MDSYPNEFTAHHRPLLYVAGLGTGAPGQPGAPPAGAATSPIASAPPQESSNDPFTILQAALRKTLASRRAFPLWDTSRGTQNDFHTVLVDKNIRFPPLKARPASNAPPTATGPPALHSPISPLTPTSPLYPDGIIAPIWIRKHRELVPSVFILVLRLHEAHGAGTSRDPAEREDEERHHDGELVREIVDRKRSTLERGIKLAVVLLCSRQLLDDPALDIRLSLIRRQSGLDTRASLFVISPVPQSEVTNFVLSLRAELYPAALDYYREHGRRVRRKRTRQAQRGGLSERGWNVRYDYKLALFAEMRGEIEVSLKHYEDCYDTLVDMFGQPELLVARTKRWAEAKVLADCVSIKICKMYLYLNEPSRALAQLNRHVFRFRELSNSWKIGEDTFEFWSWLSKQYRLFGDLTTIALRSGFRLPSLRPPPTPRLPPAAAAAGAAGQFPSPGLVPLNVLQHAGHYYHLAAVCAVARRDTFRAAARRIDEAAAGEQGQAGDAATSSPALAHERKVDHAEIIVELFTKAYEFFKAHRAKNMTFCIAAEIASAHLEAGKFDTALKFYDRIAKNYRRDGWRDVLDMILERSFRAALECQDWPSALRAGFELLAPTSRVSTEQREEYARRVVELLQTQVPPAPEQARLELDMTDMAPLFECHLAFLRPSTHTSQPVPFQLSLSAPSTARSGKLTFDHLELHFNDDRPPLRVSHADVAAQTAVEHVALGHVGSEQDRTASLRWGAGESKVLTGSISADRELELTVEKVVLTAEIGAWTVVLTMQPERVPDTSLWRVGDKAVPLLGQASTCRVTRRELRVNVSTECATPAYLDERFPIHVDVSNDDEVEMQVYLLLFLQPGEDGSHDRILVDDQASNAVIESLPLGTVAPGSSLRKTFHLETLGGIPGPRNIDVTVRALPLDSPATPDLAATLPPTATEVTRALSVPAIRPIHASFDTQVYKRKRPVKPLTDLSEPDGWEGASDAMVVAGLTAAGPWDIEVLGVYLHADAPWCPGDVFNALFRLDVLPDTMQPHDSNVQLELRWRRSGTDVEPASTHLRLAAPKPVLDMPTITLALPPFLTVHQPATVTYRFSNPTGRVVTLSSQVDSSTDVPSTFVFAGPRRLPEWTLAPYEEREVQVRVVPLAAGHCALPRMRVWQIEHPPPPTRDELETRVDEEGRAIPPPPRPQPKVHEVEVEVESEAIEEVDPAQAELEADLRSAREGDESESNAGGKAPPGRPHIVLVLPR
ncbi:hypothetical protein Rhopal_004776-T1 [Rhodotorula paludigena]|uniref:Trafficking protein particle complex subunit 11 domain-containing protein n=1 Tax=Rhodotorula paludigena TaxID=86838 RepID=A0AAV5GNI8_9BASI|nr:hypothetical protein Rhopal_004776-T1 [Rhodotorula paludigena]